MSVGTPDNIVGVISKLLTDLVARNDQARSRSPPRAHWPDRCHRGMDLAALSMAVRVRPAAPAGADASDPVSLVEAADDQRQELPRGSVPA